MGILEKVCKQSHRISVVNCSWTSDHRRRWMWDRYADGPQTARLV